MSPICAKCGVEMHCHKTGRRVGLVSGGNVYQVWSGDEFACPTCRASVVVGFPRDPLGEWDDPGFGELVKLEEGRRNLIRVNV
jgi:hypothetical protein